jgi:REP element-mobilizing transposase RayT
MDSYSHKVGESTFHFVFVTKCRYKVLRRREHKYLCRDVLNQVAKRHGMRVLSLAIDDDHVHMVALLHPAMSPSEAFRLLKGASSFALLRIIPNMRKRSPRGFWGRNGTFRSVGDVDTNTVVHYSERHNQAQMTAFISQENRGLKPADA